MEMQDSCDLRAMDFYKMKLDNCLTTCRAECTGDRTLIPLQGWCYYGCSVMSMKVCKMIILKRIPNPVLHATNKRNHESKPEVSMICHCI